MMYNNLCRYKAITFGAPQLPYKYWRLYRRYY